MPYSDIFRHIVAYLEPCVTLAYSEHSHILILAHLEPKIYPELCQSISGTSKTLCNARILRTLTYFNFTIFRILGIFRPNAYSKSCLFRHIQAYSITIIIITLNFFFYLNLIYFCFLTTMMSI